MGFGVRMSTCVETRIFNIYHNFPRDNVSAGNFFFLSGETINYELPMLDLFPAICGRLALLTHSLCSPNNLVFT